MTTIYLLVVASKTYNRDPTAPGNAVVVVGTIQAGQPNPGPGYVYAMNPASSTQPSPYGQAPVPVYGQPVPVYAQPAPVYGQPAPVYGQPAPVYGQPAPVYGQAPGYAPPAAGYVPVGYAPASSEANYHRL